MNAEHINAICVVIGFAMGFISALVGMRER